MSATPASGDAPLEVVFSGLGSTDTDGVITDWAWDFGDGSPVEHGMNVLHTYAQGAYTAELTVTDTGGATATVSQTIEVGPPNVKPVASFTRTPERGYSPVQVQLDGSASTDSDGSIVSYEWYFDQTTAGGTPDATGPVLTHTFTDPGGNHQVPVTLRVTDDDGATDVEALTIVSETNEPPTAWAQANPAFGSEDLLVNFVGSGSTDAGSLVGGTIAAYHWDFDDGATSTLADPAHTYADPGTYTATLTVTDDGGLSDTATIEIQVNANLAPEAVAFADELGGQAPFTTSFHSTGTHDDDGSVVSYSWNFGDATPVATGPDVTHEFTSVGTHTVTLTVTDDDGATDTATVTINVSPPPVDPF